MPNPGVSFSPFSQPDQQQNGQRMGASPVQDAIKLLSFRLPRNLGGSAIAPAPLIQGGATALGPQLGNAIADNWIKALLQGQAMPQAPPMGAPSMTAPGMPQPPQAPPMGGAEPTGGMAPGANPFTAWLQQEQRAGGVSQQPPHDEPFRAPQISNTVPVNVGFGDAQRVPPPSDQPAPFSYGDPPAAGPPGFDVAAFRDRLAQFQQQFRAR